MKTTKPCKHSKDTCPFWKCEEHHGLTSSKQLREVEKLLWEYRDDCYDPSPKNNITKTTELKAKQILDSVREEYKHNLQKCRGMIEGLRMEKPNYGREGAPLNSYWEGYNQAIDEFNSEIDEVLKKI